MRLLRRLAVWSYRERVDWIRAHLAEPDNCRRLLKDDESLDWWLQAINLLDVQQPRPIDIKRGRVSIDSLRDSDLPPYSPGWEASLDQTAKQSLTLVNLWRWLQIEERWLPMARHIQQPGIPDCIAG